MKNVAMTDKFVHIITHTKSKRIRKKYMDKMNRWFRSLPVAKLVVYTDFKW
jgi:hypothetical protein